MTSYIINKKLCDISKGIPFLEKRNCKKEKFTVVPEDLVDSKEIKEKFDDFGKLLKSIFTKYGKIAKVVLKDYFESIFTLDKKKFNPLNLVYFMGGIMVILIIIIGVVAGSQKMKSMDVNNLLKMYEFPIPPPPPPPPVNFIMSQEIAPIMQNS